MSTDLRLSQGTPERPPRLCPVCGEEIHRLTVRVGFGDTAIVVLSLDTNPPTYAWVCQACNWRGYRTADGQVWPGEPPPAPLPEPPS